MNLNHQQKFRTFIYVFDHFFGKYQEKRELILINSLTHFRKMLREKATTHTTSKMCNQNASKMRMVWMVFFSLFFLLCTATCLNMFSNFIKHCALCPSGTLFFMLFRVCMLHLIDRKGETLLFERDDKRTFELQTGRIVFRICVPKKFAELICRSEIGLIVLDRPFSPPLNRLV